MLTSDWSACSCFSRAASRDSASSRRSSSCQTRRVRLSTLSLERGAVGRLDSRRWRACRTRSEKPAAAWRLYDGVERWTSPSPSKCSSDVRAKMSSEASPDGARAVSRWCVVWSRRCVGAGARARRFLCSGAEAVCVEAVCVTCRYNAVFAAAAARRRRRAVAAPSSSPSPPSSSSGAAPSAASRKTSTWSDLAQKRSKSFALILVLAKTTTDTGASPAGAASEAAGVASRRAAAATPSRPPTARSSSALLRRARSPTQSRVSSCRTSTARLRTSTRELAPASKSLCFGESSCSASRRRFIVASGGSAASEASKTFVRASNFSLNSSRLFRSRSRFRHALPPSSFFSSSLRKSQTKPYASRCSLVPSSMASPEAARAKDPPTREVSRA
mmetsp:Transcript_26728/g.89939  ORF Transcript_26728/g.89939 Transcript_26728/m.89939 type:complete len:388 (+) Transcript_26728:445-1608(+)